MPRSRRRKNRHQGTSIHPGEDNSLRVLELVPDGQTPLQVETLVEILMETPIDGVCSNCGTGGVVVGALDNPELLIARSQDSDAFRIFCPGCAPAGEIKGRILNLP